MRSLIVLPLAVSYRCHGSTPHRLFPAISWRLYGLLLAFLIVGMPGAVRASGGTLIGSINAAPPQVDLTKEGELDWVHWGLSGTSDAVRKREVAPLIGNYSPLTSESATRTSGSTAAFNWSDGDYPFTTYSSAYVQLRMLNTGSGYQVVVPAGGKTRILQLYVAASRSKGILKASLSDGSAPAYVGQIEQVNDTSSHVVTLKFQATSSNATLKITYTKTEDYFHGYGDIRLTAAALKAGADEAISPPRTTPVTTVTAEPTTSVPNPVGTPPAANASDSGFIDIASTTPRGYVWDVLKDGKPMFIDRDYVFGETETNGVPDNYHGMHYLRAAKNDYTSTGSAFVTFKVHQPATVYVAHSDQIVAKPAWLNTWQDTGDDIVGRSIFRKQFQAGTVTLGGNTANGVDASGSMYMVLVAGSGSPVANRVINAVPVAVDDKATIEVNSLATINVTANDRGLAAAPLRIALIGGPTHGSASISGNTLTYRPAAGFVGVDNMTYRVTDANGDLATASVAVTVGCPSCSVAHRRLTLTWNAVSDNVLGYYVYSGPTANAVMQAVGKVAIPWVTMNSATDLQLQPGSRVCFRVMAYNSVGVSGYSEAVCTSL